MANASKTAAASALREQVESSSIEDGTVLLITWAEYPENKKRRNRGEVRHVSTYSARTGLWYTVGAGATLIAREARHRAFIDILGNANVMSVELVTSTTAVKP